jgi:fructokinase
MFRLGIDLGGTKIEAALLNSEGTIAWKKRIASPQHDYRATLAAIESLVADAQALVVSGTVPDTVPDTTIQSIGIGIPGSRSPANGLVRNANSTWLNGKPLKTDLEALLGGPVQMANDANCLALSESVDGAGRGAAFVFGVILGTGVGGGFAIHQQVLQGANRIAGEWGHTPLPWPSDSESSRPRVCWCGQSNCIETYLSGPALVREFNETASLGVQRVEEIVQAAASGHGDARACLELFYGRLARALAMVINIVDPDVIVIGGGLSNIAAIYTEVPRRWGQWVFSAEPVVTRLVPAMHGDSSGVRGAAWLTS